MAENTIALIIAILSPVLFFALIWWIDIWEREPFREVAIRVLWGGGVAGIIVSFIYSIIGLEPIKSHFLYGAAIEELIKGLGVIFIFSRTYPFKDFQREPDSEASFENTFSFLSFRWLRSETQGEVEIDSPLDGLVYGAMVGLGFSLSEKIIYYVIFPGTPNELVFHVILNSLILGASHAIYSGIVGLGIVYGRFQRGRGLERFIYPISAYITAVTLHAYFNYSTLANIASVQSIYALGFSILIGLILFFLNQERSWIYQELTEEVELKTLPKNRLDLILSYRFRLMVEWKALFNKDPIWKMIQQYLQICSELGLKKYKQNLIADVPGLIPHITGLKKDIYWLDRKISREEDKPGFWSDL